LIRAVVEMKQRNPTWGCPHIADQINLAFGTSINKDVVRRILAQHYQPMPTEGGPSWLTFIGHVKDSLWSLLRSGTITTGIEFMLASRQKRRSKLRDLEVRTSNHIVGSHIVIGSIKHQSRREHEFAIDRSDPLVP